MSSQDAKMHEHKWREACANQRPQWDRLVNDDSQATAIMLRLQARKQEQRAKDRAMLEHLTWLAIGVGCVIAMAWLGGY